MTDDPRKTLQEMTASWWALTTLATAAEAGVLDAVGVGSTLEAAAARSYRAADRVQFEGKAFRRDIAGTPLIRSDQSGRSQPAGRADRRGEDEG